MNRVVIVLVLTTVAASLACMHLVSELRDERARAEALQTQVTGLERTLADREQATRTAAAHASPFSPFFEVIPVAREPQSDSRTDGTPADSSERRAAINVPPDVREHFERQRKLMEDPKYREAMRRQQRIHMDGMYPGLEDALGLSAEETGRFLDLLSQHRADEMVAGSEMRVWDPTDTEAMEKAHDAIAQRQQHQQQEIDEQFGPNVRQKWTEYQETIGARHRLGAMQSQLALAGAPLDAQQSKAVLNVLVEEQQRQMQEYANTIGARSEIRYTANSVVASPPDWNVTDWTQNRERAHERMLSSLQSSLTQEQLEHIEGILKREREAQRASMELMQAQGINDGGRNAIIATGSFAPIGGVSLQQVETREVEAPGED